jgi:hypothetical protein
MARPVSLQLRSRPIDGSAGEFRLKDEPARAGMAQASPSRLEENLDACSKA